MADGASPISGGTLVRAGGSGGGDVPPPRLKGWLFKTRSGLLTLWAIIAAIALVAPLVVLVAGFGFTPAEPARWYYLAASTVFWLPLVLFALDPEDTVASGPKLLMPIATTLLLVILTSLVVADYYAGTNHLTHAPQRTAFFAFLALAFIPRVWNAVIFAYHRGHNRRAAERAALRQPKVAGQDQVQIEIDNARNAESIGALLATCIVAFLGVGAFFLGSFSEPQGLGSSLGTVIFFLVIALFAAIVFLDWIARFPPLRALAKTLNRTAPRIRRLADLYDWIDTGLVRIGSHVAGADHLKTRSRYGVLISTLVSLALLAWFLPPPLGLIPVSAGLIIALSLSRLWSWVEEDRDMAAVTNFSPRAPQRVGFREDFRDETLLGFIFVLLMLPIGMMQAHQGNGYQLFQYATEPHQVVQARDNFGIWLGYFGFELAKALPIVDWADIYKLGPGSDSIQPIWPNGMHAVFLARVLVDLILIAALLQAIGIASRNRRQKALFATRRIDRLDELVEKAELQRAIRETRVRGDKLSFKLGNLAKPDLVDFRFYNKQRLRQIHLASSDDPETAGFIGEIFRQSGEKLAPAIIVALDIASSHRNEPELVRTFDQAVADDAAGIYPIGLHEIRIMMSHLRAQSGMREFKQHVIQFAEESAKGSPELLLEVLADIGLGDGRDHYQYTVRNVGAAIQRTLPKVTLASQVEYALDAGIRNGEKAFGAAGADLAGLLKALRTRLEQLKPSARDLQEDDTQPD